MATWLRYQFAERNKIMAMVEFPLPATLLWQLVLKLTDQDHNDNSYAEDNMRWHLFSLLRPDNAAIWERPAFKPLNDFLSDDQDGRKRFQLASWIADIFSQYLIYRPHWMLSWRSGKLTNEHDPVLALASQQEPWQPILWRMLVEHLQATPDRAMLQEQACRRLITEADSGSLVTEVLGQQLFVFGLSSMPPERVRLLMAIAKHIDIHLHLFNPCQEYWFDVVSPSHLARLTASELTQDVAAPRHLSYEKHPLLGTLGRSGAEFIDLLLEFHDQVIIQEDFHAPNEDSLLHILQKNILEMRTISTDDERQQVKPTDPSLQFASCHGAVREVEALYDWLLDRFATDETLMPKDIVVMIPRINDYAAAVETVFGAARDGLQIPYSICDHNQGPESLIIATLIQFLRLLPQSRLEASELLDLLKIPAVMRKFGLDAPQLSRVQYLVEASGIRWGRDAAHWQQLGFAVGKDETSALPCTWQFGLERMMVSYSLGEDAASFRNLAPFPGINDANDEVLAALLNFIACIDHYRQLLGAQHSISRWGDIFRQMATDFFLPELNEQAVLDDWYQDIKDLTGLENETGMKEPVDLKVILDAFENKWARARNSHRFLNGKVTFCTLMPMRNIPFQAVALLGMNEQDFPRGSLPLSFNLLDHYPRKGDPNHRADELYMFLEAILAAQDYLYLSWSGHDPRNNKMQMPAAVILGLQDVINSSFTLSEDSDAYDNAAQAFTVQHPLQPFSSQYQPDKARLKTYSSLWAKSAKNQPEQEIAPVAQLQLPPITPETNMSLHRLAQFFCNPHRALLAQQFTVWPPGVARQPDDSEPFTLTGLARYSFKSDALKQLQSNKSMSGWVTHVRSGALLPMGFVGDELLSDAQRMVKDYQRRLQLLLVRPPESPMPIYIQCTQTTLVDELHGCRGDFYLKLRAGDAGHKDFMRLWINHLGLAASNHHRISLLADETYLYYFLAMEQERAKQLLEQLLEVRAQYLQELAPLTADSGAEWAEQQAKQKTKKANNTESNTEGLERDFLNRARRKWELDFHGRGESGSWEARRLWEQFPGDIDVSGFIKLTDLVWRPLYNELQKSKNLENLSADLQ